QTAFESMKDLQDASGQCAYAPFADRSEWELADWLVKNVNQGATDKFLKLGIVSHINLDCIQTCERTQPTYKSTYTFMKLVDQLPTGPEWQCELVRVRSDVGREAGDAEEGEDADRVDSEQEEDDSEELELWLQDPVACVRELIGNAALKNEMAYAPEKVYTDSDGQMRRFDEM
ncbi:hypothetical protein L210DRAFT_837540, partial [Boletus edulis BED1]